MNRSVLIVGAGPGGLAAAMLLRQAGLDVTVLERLDQVGGRTASIRVDASETDAGRSQADVAESPELSDACACNAHNKDAETPAQCTCHGHGTGDSNQGQAPTEFRFDRGPTFFLYPQVLEEVFAACGRDLYDEVEMIRLDPQYRLVFDEGRWGRRCRMDTTGDLSRMAGEIARFNRSDSDNLCQFITDNRKKFQAFKPILQRSWESWRQFLSPSMAKTLPLVRPWASVDRDLKRYFDDPRVRLAFSFQSKYLGMSPFQCPSLFTILSYLEYDYGVYHPVGGCGAVSEAMARVAREMGVEVRLADEVRQVMLEGKRVVGLRSDSGEHRADCVVINADFADAISRMVPDHARRRWSDDRLSKKRYSCSTFMMYLGIKGRYNHLPHHTIFLSGDYEKNLRQIEKDHVLPDEPSIYLENPSPTDSTLAPPGYSTLYVLAPVSHQHPNTDWASQRGVFRRRTLDRLKRLGLRDLEERIVYEKLLTPDDWQAQMHIYRGATFNLAHCLGQMLHRRPRNRFEDLDGVYLVGGGTHPGSGLPVIYESARITTRLILNDLNIDPNSARPRPKTQNNASADSQPEQSAEAAVDLWGF